MIRRDWYNNKLGAKGVYNRLRQQQLQVCNTIRNNADHGHFTEYELEDVKRMAADVQGFLAQYIASS